MQCVDLPSIREWHSSSDGPKNNHATSSMTLISIFRMPHIADRARSYFTRKKETEGIDHVHAAFSKLCGAGSQSVLDRGVFPNRGRKQPDTTHIDSTSDDHHFWNADSNRLIRACCLLEIRLMLRFGPWQGAETDRCVSSACVSNLWACLNLHTNILET
jgi:hypothetical protein